MRYCGPLGIPLSVFLSWSIFDQDAALDYQGFEARRCGSCGTHPDDWVSDRTAFHAELHQCMGCVEAERTADTLPDDERPRGLQIRLVHGGAGRCPRCVAATIDQE
jgi:hypothetical protein